MSEVKSLEASPEPKLIRRSIYEHVQKNWPVEAAVIENALKTGEARIVD